MSVFRCYSEKKPGFDVEAQGLCRQLREQLGVESLESVRILNRYDADHIDPAVYQAAKTVVFSEPQVDDIWDETYPAPDTVHSVLAVEALPGQFDQRADSCAQCIQLQSGVDRPLIAYAKVYLLGGQLSQNELEKIRKYLINPVESREASVDKPATLVREHAAPDRVAVVEGFTALDEKGLAHLLSELGLAMDLDDLKFLQTYFRDEEKRDPTITEVRVVDTYWSDHCRHTTFSTHLDAVDIGAPAVKAAYQRYLDARVEVYGEEKAAKRPQTLMDIATIGCAAAVRLDGTVISGIRLAYSVSAPIPVRCPSAEAAALGRSATPEDLPATLDAISAAVEADVQPRTSWRANRDFRMHIIRTLAERVIARCVVRAVELQEAASC